MTVTLIRRRLPIILLCGLIGLAAAGVIALTSGESYRATARLFVGTSAQDITSASQGDIAAKSRARTYVAIATSEDLLRRAAKQSGDGVSGDALASSVVVSSLPDTTLIDVSATASSPDAAAAMAQAVADTLVGVVGEVEKPIRSGQPSIGLINVQAAANGVTKVPRFDPVSLALFTVGGLAIGFAGALLIPARVRSPRRSGRMRRAAVGSGDRS